MTDQLKASRLWLAVLVCLVGALSAAAQDANQPTDPNGASTDSLKWVGHPQPDEETIQLGSFDPDGKFLLRVELTNEGAAVRSARLRDHFLTVEDKRLWDKDPQAYAKAREENPGTYKGHYEVVQEMGEGENRTLPMATRRVDVTALTGGLRPLSLPRLDRMRWVVEQASPNSVTFRYTIYLGENTAAALKNPVLHIRKNYTLVPDSYKLVVSTKVENVSDTPFSIAIDQVGTTGLPYELGRSDSRRIVAGQITDLEHQAVTPVFKGVGELDDVEIGKAISLGRNEGPKPVVWLGQSNRFFTCLMHPVPEAKDTLIVSPSRYVINYAWGGIQVPAGRALVSRIQLSKMNVNPGKTSQLKLNVFCGPKKRTIFSPVFLDVEAKAYRPLYEKLNYISTLDFSTCFCAWDALTVGMMWLLDKLSWLAMGNMGVAIMLLVLVVRTILHPITRKSQVSMMQMQKLAPRMEELKKKYADDKDTLQRETMSLYKEAGTSPLLGCLPMFLQMPIWIGLWSSINASVELRHAAFLPVWLTDLAAPDQFIEFGFTLPLIGDSLNLLPLLLCVAMFLQTKLNPQMSGASAASTKPEQVQTQKMMRIMMPAMMLIFFYHMPSGLNLYIMSSTFIGVAEQYLIRKHIREKEEEEKLREVKVAAPGKQSRHSRPKKPKGPFWNKQG
ncbi:MAG: YidC/Oxa1 family insertase periplasmic-domain containing protein [Phycisphaerae bacterium]